MPIPLNRWAPTLLLLQSGLASAASLELRVLVDADGARVIGARPSEAGPDPLMVGAPRFDVLDDLGDVIGSSSLPDPRLRTVIAPEGGHGDAATLVAGVVRVRVPWAPGARLRLDGIDLAIPEATSLPRLPAPPRVAQLVDAGPANQRLDLVFLGDGYTSNQQGAFREDVDRMVAYLLSIEPYGAYEDLFNIWRIEVDSPQSGASHDERGTRVDTALGCAYGCAGIDRLICCDDNAVMSTVEAAVPGADGVMVLVNDPAYGGSGGFNYATSYVGGFDDTQVAAHELGHSLIGLWDEYGYGQTGGGSGPNCSASTAGSWDSWIGSQGVGAFQECSYTQLYRPTVDECMMRTLRDDYCPVCRQEAVLAMYRRLPGLVASINIAPGEVSVPEGEEATLAVATHPPAKLLNFSWTLDGDVVSTDRNLELSCSGLKGELWLDVSDDTSWVREDPGSDLHETIGPWMVDAEACAPSLAGSCNTSGSLGAWLAPFALLALRRRS